MKMFQRVFLARIPHWYHLCILVASVAGASSLITVVALKG